LRQISTCSSPQPAMTCSPLSSVVQTTKGSDLDLGEQKWGKGWMGGTFFWCPGDQMSGRWMEYEWNMNGIWVEYEYERNMGYEWCPGLSPCSDSMSLNWALNAIWWVWWV
jgi:hypothetical protein